MTRAAGGAGCYRVNAIIRLRVDAVLCFQPHTPAVGLEGSVAASCTPAVAPLPAPRNPNANRFPEGSLELLYGCEDGQVVQLMVERGAVRQGFTIPPPPGGGEVRALHCGADYSKVGLGACWELWVGRCRALG
jgi:hypothetical protein